jgi:hypothetical protein
LVLGDISRPLINSYYYEATFFSLLRAKSDPPTRSHQPSVLFFNTLQKMHVFDRLTRNKELRLQCFRHVAFRENSKSKVVDLNGSITRFQPYKRQCILALDFQASLIPTISSQVNRSIVPTLVTKATRDSCTTSAKVLGRVVLLTLFGLEPLGGVSCCSLVLLFAVVDDLASDAAAGCPSFPLVEVELPAAALSAAPTHSFAALRRADRAALCLRRLSRIVCSLASISGFGSFSEVSTGLFVLGFLAITNSWTDLTKITSSSKFPANSSSSSTNEKSPNLSIV